jgi:ketosteroid isomerase-like protein
VPAGLSDTEVVQRSYDVWNDDDLERFLTLTHPEAEYIPSGIFPGMASAYRGREGVRRWWETFHEPWREIRVVPERIVERGEEIAVLVRFEGTGRDGVATTMSFINRIEVREGLLYRLVGQPAGEEALRELGLD